MSANTLLVHDLKLAACYRAMGFRYDCKPVIHERTETLNIQFLFQLTSLRFPTLNLQTLADQWKSGALRQTDPMHVLCVMMAAQWNYDALLVWLKEGARQRLKAVATGRMTRYFTGDDAAGLLRQAETVPVDDMRLAACLGLMGLPIVDISSVSASRHTFHIARTGYAVLLDDGRQHLHNAGQLMKRAPTPQDPLRLQLEDDQPLHPLCLAYDALYNRGELKRELGRPSLLLIDSPGARLADNGAMVEKIAVKQALVDVNARGHVMDQVTAHMQSPPISWP